MAEILYLPLADAYLCQDCNCVSNRSRCCPACASESILGLAAVLNREPAEAPGWEPQAIPQPA